MQLTIRGLSKTYPNGTQAVKDVSLDIPPGMFGLLGRNGAGKSTLMRILATLQDLFETVTVWDVKTERAMVERTGTGEYRVTLDVVARKLKTDTAGKVTEVAMDDLIEIGAFAPGKGIVLGEPLYLKRHRIRSGKQTISITVPKEPARAGIDPYRKLIERIGRDNVKPIALIRDVIA